MNDTIWQQIAATSWWMIVIFGLMAYRSYQTTKPKIIPIGQLAAVVILCAAASMLSVYLFAQINQATIAWLTLMILSGSICGWVYYWRLNIICYHEESKMMIPGSWLNPLLLISAATIIYLSGISLPTDPNALISKAYSASVITFYGCVTGFMMGRFLYGMYLFKKTAPSH